MNDKLLNKISIRMQEINKELNELRERKNELNKEKSRLIESWERETERN